MDRCEGCGTGGGVQLAAVELLSAERRTAVLCRGCLSNPDADWRWRLRVLGRGDPVQAWADQEHPDVLVSGRLAVRRTVAQLDQGAAA